MDVNLILDLVKARLGISTNVRDAYLIAIIEGLITELEGVYGLALDGGSPHHLMFVVDYATWRYQSVATKEGVTAVKPPPMPRHLQYRLHNLLIHKGGD